MVVATTAELCKIWVIHVTESAVSRATDTP